MRCCVTRSAQLFTIQGQTKVYELITKIEGTNQSTRNALSEVENLIIIIRPFLQLAEQSFISENVIDQGRTMRRDSSGSRNRWEKRMGKQDVDKIICD